MSFNEIDTIIYYYTILLYYNIVLQHSTIILNCNITIGVTKNNVTFFRIVVLQCSWSVRNDVVAGGVLLGSGYCRGNSWRLAECILLLGECVWGPAMIFGGAGLWRALWASASLLRVVPGREKMVEGKKGAKKSVDNSMLRIFIRDNDR